MRFDANCSDVKCLHAHVGDELSRGGNAIGRQAMGKTPDFRYQNHSLSKV
jgi:hypothetical protein